MRKVSLTPKEPAQAAVEDGIFLTALPTFGGQATFESGLQSIVGGGVTMVQDGIVNGLGASYTPRQIESIRSEFGRVGKTLAKEVSEDVARLVGKIQKELKNIKL